MPTEKFFIGEMTVESDALDFAKQHIQIFYLPAAGAWRHKLSFEQRLVSNGDGKDSAPTVCIRFQEFGPLNAFTKDLFLSAYLEFGLREGKHLDWMRHELINAVSFAVDKARRERVVGVV